MIRFKSVGVKGRFDSPERKRDNNEKEEEPLEGDNTRDPASNARYAHRVERGRGPKPPTPNPARPKERLHELFYKFAQISAVRSLARIIQNNLFR